ncbi:MAG TPA: type II toxin-antitoxin system prevent-host-death family antitoxin [Thermoanaerobaculia bacterium]|nr:type II toxin-antitoxin system prevent-host-death family antitoxin [Thermoanaerobaculia bacterium]
MTKTVPAAEAQAHFLELLDDVAERNVEVLVTRDGEPVAKVVPIRAARRSLEQLRGSVTILGDIVSPLDEEWDANE